MTPSDRDVGQPGGADRPAIPSRAAQPSCRGEPLDQAAEGRRLGRFRRGEEVVDRRRRSSAELPLETARQAAESVAAWVVDAFVGAGQLEPAAAERASCAGRGRTSDHPRPVRPGHRPHRRRRGPSRRAPSRIASWMARQRSRWSAPGCVVLVSAWSPEWTVESRPPWRYRISPASGAPAAVPVARLEIDEVTGHEGRVPPADEASARPEREVAPLTGLQEQVVEPVERRGRGLARRDEALPWPSRPGHRVMADDATSARLRAPDPLTRGLGDRLEDRAPRRRPGTSGSEMRCRDGWISSIGRNPAASMVARNAASAAGTSASAATTSIPSPASASPMATSRPPSAVGVRADRHRAARHVRTATTDDRPRPRQRERPAAVVGDQEPRPPAADAAVLRPGPRLVDVAAGRIDGQGVPVLELGRGRVAARSIAPPRRPPRLPPARTPPRRRAQRTRARWPNS